MPTLDPRVDDYLAAAPDYARPILNELRQRIHAACPDVVETLKWRMQSFEHHGLLGGMAAFKSYCTFGFWKEPLLLQEGGAVAEVVKAVGKMSALSDLPPKRAFAAALRRAIELNESGVKVPRAAPGRRAEIPVPPDFAKALAANARAKKTFDAFAPSHRREYLEWITEAKREATRQSRIEQAIEWIGDGKHRHWKYER